MCGRFSLTSPAAVLAEHFDVELPERLVPRFNIAPTHDVLVVRRASADQPGDAGHCRWGLIPSWAKDPSIGNRMINARSETAATKPAFRSAMRRRRCLIPADGFYEWSAGPSGTKQPYRIALESGEPFAFAGLWERWEPVEEDAIESCTILTTTANELLSTLHARMPVMLDPDDYDRWLVADPEAAAPLDLLRPRPTAGMHFFPVSRRVNSPRHDDESCIEPIELNGPNEGGSGAGGQGSLPLAP